MAIPALVPLGLQAASFLGGLFGKKRKHIDPEYLRQHFGAKAQAEEAQQIVNYLSNSPYGQQLLATAAEQGQGFANQMAQRAAAAGLDPSSGGQAGAGDFATSAASQAQTGFERDTRRGFYDIAAPIAERNVAAARDAYLQDKYGGGYQDDKARGWEAIGQAAGGALAAAGPGAARVPAPNAQQEAAVAAANGVAPAGAMVAAAPLNTAGGGTILPQAGGRPLGAYGARARTIADVLRGSRNVRPGRGPYDDNPEYR